MSPEGRTGAPRRRLSAERRREVIELAATEVFAEHGFDRASIDEIARRSGVSAPVVYDHFESKRDLHARLLEKHLAEMRAVWSENLTAEGDPVTRIAGAIDAWFAYVEAHPYAWRMIFRETTGDPEVQAAHKEIQAQSRLGLVPLLASIPGADRIADPTDPVAADMIVELLRSAIAGLALWWYDHRDVPRAQVVAAVMNTLWVGLERLAAGGGWEPSASAGGAAQRG